MQVTTRIKARPLDEPVDYLDVQLPRARPDALAPLAGTNPTGFPPAASWATLELAMDATSTPAHHAGFPAALPWATLALGTLAAHDPEWLLSGTEVQFPDEQARAARRARVKLSAAPKDDASVVLKGEYTLPASLHKIRLDLPRPLAIEDYYRVLTIGNPQLSADGKSVTFTIATRVEDDNSTKTEAFRVATNASAPPERVDGAGRAGGAAGRGGRGGRGSGVTSVTSPDGAWIARNRIRAVRRSLAARQRSTMSLTAASRIRSSDTFMAISIATFAARS